MALFAGLSLSSRGQSTFFIDFKPYSQAAVVLTTGTILNGSLKLHHQAETISVRCANDSVYTLPAQLVLGFAVKDDPAQQRAGDSYVALERVFRTFPLVTSKKSKTSVWGFYEQLSQGPGPVLLLRREEATACDVLIPNGTGGLATDLPTPITMKLYPCDLKTTYYLRTAAGVVVALRKPKDVLNHFPRQAPQLRAYAQQNDLRYANARELSFLVNYANTLLKTTP